MTLSRILLHTAAVAALVVASAATAQTPPAALGDLNVSAQTVTAEFAPAQKAHAEAIEAARKTGWHYTMTAFTNASQSNMAVFDSADGASFVQRRANAFSPPGGLIRDPSVMKHTDGWYYVTYTTGWTGNTIGIARSRDMTEWTFVRNVQLDVGQTNTWAPEWFIDDDGSVNIIVSLSRTGTNGQFTPHLLAATNKDLSTWSAPKPLDGLGANHIDTFVVKSGGLYHAITKNETTKYLEHATAKSLAGPWTIDGTDDWAGWGNWLEGPALTQLPDGTWRIYFDEYREKRYWYSDSKDLKTWTKRTELPSLSGVVRHFTVLREKVAPAPAAQPTPALAHTVTWDKYSLKVDDQRIFSWGGEFHPFRTPNPDLWRDIMQKMKANGYNTVAIYVFWGYHSPKQGVYDFSGIRDIDKLLTMAKEEGLYVITRAGPYVNAELTRGGYPGWLVTQTARARTDAPEYLNASAEWLTQINHIIAKHQITNGGGTVIAHQIENELDVVGPTQQRYMQWLYDKAKADGITVPVFHNDKGRNGLWVPKGSNVPGTMEGPTDLYAFDGYPGGSCRVDSTPSAPGIAPDWGLYGSGARSGGAASPNTPAFAAEFGGGWFDYWGSNGDYDCTAQHRGVGYQRVFYGTNIANAITLQSFYMTYGGTSWGWMPAPVVFTSYDYGSAITEERGLRDKILTMKLMGDFINSVPDLTQMDKGDLVVPSNERVKVYHNINNRTGTHLYVVLHGPTSLTGDESFTFQVITRDGNYTVPSRIKGQDSKMLLASYDLGGQRLVYSTSELQTHAPWNDGDIALFYGRQGEAGETVLRYKSAPKVEVLDGQVQSSFDAARGDLKLTYTHQGLARVRISGADRKPLTLLLADLPTAETFWHQKTDAGVTLQRGPQLVRTAKITGSTLALTGDTERESPLEVFAPKGVKTVTWNGQRIAVTATPSGSLLARATLAGPEAYVAPDLSKSEWRWAPGSPESDPAFDDSAWRSADARSGAGTIAPPNGQPILAADAYGFHNGDVWYRGRYTARGDESKLTLHYGGGGVGMLQLWIDGQFIGQNELPAGQPRPQTVGQVTFEIPEALRGKKQHLISVMVRNDGHNWDLDADDFHKEPRGLISASLSGPATYNFVTPIDWKIQGNRGGEDIQDPVRGVLNNGGLAGERMDWHLPGFPDKSWEVANMAATKPYTGTSWYRTTFDVNAPKGHDVTLGLQFGDPTIPRSPTAKYRVLIFVNGWNMGQFIAHVGPQRTFMLPPGIVNMAGKNTLALAVTSDGAPGDALEEVKLVTMRNVRGGIPISLVPAPDYKP
jgi:beta-galactosidase GanA